MRVLDETTFIAGLLGASLALVGASDLDWKKAYLILVSGSAIAYLGTPLIVRHMDYLTDFQGLVGFMLGLIGIKLVYWITTSSLKDIGNVINRILKR